METGCIVELAGELGLLTEQLAQFLLDFLVLALDQAEDALVGGVGLALQALHITVGDIMAGYIVGLNVHQLVLHHVLDLFHAHGTVQRLALLRDIVGDGQDLLLGQAALAADRIAGLGDRSDDLGDIKWNFRTVALDDLHSVPPSFYLCTVQAGASCERGTRKAVLGCVQLM